MNNRDRIDKDMRNCDYCFNTKNIKIMYHIEIINDEKTWNKLLKSEESYTENHIEPWEFYTKKEFDNFEDAISYYMIWYVSKDCCDIKMWKEIYMNDELIYENYLEPVSTLKWSIRRRINESTSNKLDKCEKEISELKNNNELMNGFIKKMGKQFEDLFYQYCKSQIE